MKDIDIFLYNIVSYFNFFFFFLYIPPTFSGPRGPGDTDHHSQWPDVLSHAPSTDADGDDRWSGGHLHPSLSAARPYRHTADTDSRQPSHLHPCWTDSPCTEHHPECARGGTGEHGRLTTHLGYNYFQRARVLGACCSFTSSTKLICLPAPSMLKCLLLPDLAAFICSPFPYLR